MLCSLESSIVQIASSSSSVAAGLYHLTMNAVYVWRTIGRNRIECKSCEKTIYNVLVSKLTLT